MQGLRAAWLHESSFRLEVYLFVLLAPLAWWLGDSGVERALMIGSMLLVLGVELLNSAIEAVIERYGPEHHELRSEEHTSELQSLMRISYAVFCLKKNKYKKNDLNRTDTAQRHLTT